MTDHSDLIADLRGVLVCPSSQRDIMNRAADALSSQSLSLSEASRALNRFQDEVWGSFDGWSKSLGWGLTGIQPECFAMMDASVRELGEARKQLNAISAAIGSPRFMDPPDGGDVSLADQVRRMRAELEAKEARLAALENHPASLADATSNPPLPDLSSLRKGAEVMRTAIKAVTDATGAYLPPNGISKDELISRVLAATDNPEINAVMLGGRNGHP